MSKIFICYRRGESSGYVGWLHNSLAQHFSQDELFRDLDSLKGGERWAERIDETLARCSVVLAVIGPSWLPNRSKFERRRRVDDHRDHVRLELEAAIRRGVPLIPVLVGGAGMPRREELPGSLQPLADWQAVRLRDESWSHDLSALQQAISHALKTAPGELGLGSVFAGHEIDALVGRGGMGIVYRGPHLQLGRIDAIKVIAPPFANDRGFRERLVRESRFASSLRHDNLLTIYDAGEEAGLVYLVMQLVNGPDLSSVIREGPLEPTRAVAILGQVAAALQAAHDRGLIHRDVKPGNILLEPTPGGDELVFLGDFGLVREATTSTSLSSTGRWMGTADYVSPEQVMGEQIDQRADVYALGCVLYEALTGRVPYPAASETAKLVAHATKGPPSLTEGRAGLPADLDVVVRKAMARNPDDRFQSAVEFRKALRGEAPIQERPIRADAQAQKREPARATVVPQSTRVHIPTERAPVPYIRPVGRPRGIAFGILLFIATFGLYGWYWVYKTEEEMKLHTADGIGGMLALVIWILLSPVMAFVIPAEIQNMYAKDGQQSPVTGWTGLWLFPFGVFIVPAIVWFVKVQEALNHYWERRAPEQVAAMAPE